MLLASGKVLICDVHSVLVYFLRDGGIGSDFFCTHVSFSVTLRMIQAHISL